MNKFIQITKIALLTIILADEVRKATKNSKTKHGIKLTVSKNGSSITHY